MPSYIYRLTDVHTWSSTITENPCQCHLKPLNRPSR